MSFRPASEAGSRLCNLFCAACLLSAVTSSFGADPLFTIRAPDSFPKTWSELSITWKPSWDETLAANYNEGAWRQAISANESLRQAADRVVSVRRIALLDEMIRHFPDQIDKRIEACATISDLYSGLGDRTRAAQWLKKQIDEATTRQDIAIKAYAGILKCADPLEAMPDARAWVEYAATGLIELCSTNSLPAIQSQAALAKQRLLIMLLQDGAYEEAERFIDRSLSVDDAGKTNRASLLATAGHSSLAADIYETAGRTNQARELRAGIRSGSLDRVGKAATKELEMRLNALLAKEKSGDPGLADPELVQDTLEATSESGAMWSPDPASRVLCWLVVERMMRSLKPNVIQPLRDLQERTGGNLAKSFGVTASESEIDRIFKRYPWSASVHESLMDFGEQALREGRYDQALRAFRNAAIHSADPSLTAAAHVGVWLSIAAAGGTRQALEEEMAPMPGSAPLPWRGTNLPAAKLKQTIRELLPPSAADVTSLASLSRLKLQLPALLATDDPLMKSSRPVARQLGPYAISRMELAGDSLFLTGPRRVACYDSGTMNLRWVKAGNSSLDTQGGRRAGMTSSRFAARNVTLGTEQSRAWMPGTNGAIAPHMVYAHLFHSTLNGAIYDITAFDAGTGQARWSTLGNREWRDLEPLCGPTVADGHVFTVATSANGGSSSPIYLICMDGETGAIRWRTRLGEADVSGDLHELARLGAGVSLREQSVFVSTDLGLIARCDARDGNLEWVRSYQSVLQVGRLREQFRREGTPPLVSGNRVFVAPRDHSGVIALEPETGRLLWETILCPSDQIMGAVGTSLVVRASGQLAGISTTSGKELWSRPIDEPTGAPAVLAGTNLFLLSRGRLTRLNAASGQTLEELRLSPSAGTEYALLPNGSLAEIASEVLPPPPAARTTGVTSLGQGPLAEDWALPCDYPALVTPAPGQGPADVFGVLSDRVFTCVRTRPSCSVAWRTILADGTDSIGFHGNRVIAARDRTLSAFDLADGKLLWSLDLPFDPKVIGGDKQVIFAGDLSQKGKVTAMNPDTGKIMWSRWFGQEPSSGNGVLSWISARHNPAGESNLVLYWSTSLFGKEGWRPGEMTVDSLSGVVREVRPFIPTEAQWPGRILFGDNARTYVRGQPFLYAASRLGFHSNTIARIGKDTLAGFLAADNESDLTPGWKRPIDPQIEGRYPGAFGFYATATRPMVKILERLYSFDNAAAKEVVYELPSAAAKTVRVIQDVREGGDTNTLMVISSDPPEPPREMPARHTHTGLKDDTGKGNVTFHWFHDEDPVQVNQGVVGYPEAGVFPAATLMNGNAKEHYRGQTAIVIGLSTLGWTNYDVFVYGYFPSSSNNSGFEVTINDGDPQKTMGFSHENPLHRTTFIRGVNYVKFAGVSGDAFRVKFGSVDWCALQIVDSTSGSEPGRKAGSIGINWTGGGIGIDPGINVGAEVAGKYWYNIGGRWELTGGYQDPVLHVDIFDKTTGAPLRKQTLPVAPLDLVPFYGDRQAVILDDGVVVADRRGIRVFRTDSSAATVTTP